VFQINFNGDESCFELAMAYYDEGLDVVPLLRKSKRPPAFFKGWAQFKEKRPDRAEVETWFKDRDDMTVALVCGKFIVVDADTPEAMAWVEENIPQTPYKVRTGKGMHYYYNNPQNYTTFATTRTNDTPIERHIDIRGEGGLIIAPYNLHANGQVYQPVVNPNWDLWGFEDLPDFTETEWLQITGNKKQNGQSSVAPFSLDGVNEGSRNDQAARLAGYLISKNLNTDFVKFFMTSWNEQNSPPLPKHEVVSVVDNVKRTHDRKNQQAPLFVQTKEDIAPPKDLYNPPGVLKNMFDFCEEIAQISQPELSMVGALALGSVSCGRMYRTDMNNFSSLYFVGVAKSGQGKENIKTFVESVLNKTKYGNLVVGDGYTSSGAVHSILKYRPTQITIMDEFGKRLENIAGQQNTNREDGIQTLMEAWGRCHGALRPDNYSLMNTPEEYAEKVMNRVCYKPAITLVGLSVPKNFYGALNSGRVADGFLNRFIIVESKEPRKVSGLKLYKKPPQNILDWVNYIRKPVSDFGDISERNSGMDVKQTIIQFDDDSRQLLNEFAEEIVKRQNILEKDNLEPLLSRSREKAMRLALICALSDNVDCHKIKGDLTRWAIDYVRYYDLMFIEACRDKVASSSTEAKIKSVLSYIRSRGEEGISKRDVDRHELFRSMKSYEVKEVIERLRNAGEIQEIEVKVGGKGRPTKRYVAVDPSYYED
jgi:hypothetical protein